MRFWDSSAIVPLIVEEASSTRCRELVRLDPVIVVWWLSRTEVLSALLRRSRGGAFEPAALAKAERRLDLFSSRWSEIEPSLDVRLTAERLLRVHALRAADALQLGAALVMTDQRPRKRPFVCLDANLAAAASKEGFDVVDHQP